MTLPFRKIQITAHLDGSFQIESFDYDLKVLGDVANIEDAAVLDVSMEAGFHQTLLKSEELIFSCKRSLLNDPELIKASGKGNSL